MKGTVKNFFELSLLKAFFPSDDVGLPALPPTTSTSSSAVLLNYCQGEKKSAESGSLYMKSEEEGVGGIHLSPAWDPSWEHLCSQTKLGSLFNDEARVPALEGKMEGFFQKSGG